MPLVKKSKKELQSLSVRVLALSGLSLILCAAAVFFPKWLKFPDQPLMEWQLVLYYFYYFLPFLSAISVC
jgi:hypothetical protein